MRHREPYELVFVVAEQNRGWILEGICQEIASRFPGPTSFHYLPESPAVAGPSLPPARAYFFSHYLLYLRCKQERGLGRRTTLVWFTHPSYAPEQGRRVARSLRSCTRLISGSSTQARALVEAGFPARKLAVITPGADGGRFRRHERTGAAVGFCGRYYPRKAPEAIEGLVRALPHREFRLLGPGWRDAPGFDRLLSRSNFRYMELDYPDYPSFYDGIDVFVSPSLVEGGPIPLLEAMMSNAVPVATRTGFAPDLIEDGVNGFLAEPGSPVAVVADLVEKAYALDADVRATVEHLSWDRFAASIRELTS